MFYFLPSHQTMMQKKKKVLICFVALCISHSIVHIDPYSFQPQTLFENLEIMLSIFAQVCCITFNQNILFRSVEFSGSGLGNTVNETYRTNSVWMVLFCPKLSS